MHESEDQYYRLAGGTVIVRPGGGEYPWLVTWLPDAQDDPAYPGFTIEADKVGIPTDLGIAGVLDWAARQPWAERAAGRKQPPPLESAPAEAQPLAVPAGDFAEFSERVRMDFGYRFAFSPEPDGSYSWAVLAESGDELQSGVADSWDDAKLAAIENLYPPRD